MENDKFKLELISKEIDLIHKKILILLGAVTGTWFYRVEFLRKENCELCRNNGI
jgi:uracil-DNA glycosylase